MATGKAASKTAPGKAVAKVEQKSTAVQTLSEEQLAALESQSEQQFSIDDLATPWLRVLQPLSGVVQKKGEDYVEGAEPGMFFNTASKELWDGEEGIHFIPVYHEPSYTEWTKGSKTVKSKFVKDHRTHALPTKQDDDNNEVLANGNVLRFAHKYFGFVVNVEDGMVVPVIFNLAGMQRRKARAWNTAMDAWREPRSNGQGTFKPQPFYGVYHITTVFESNDKGNWYGVNMPVRTHLTKDLPNGWNIFQEAAAFALQAKAGDVKEQVVEAEEVEITPAGGDGRF
jgi:hypothetical protein